MLSVQPRSHDRGRIDQYQPHRTLQVDQPQRQRSLRAASLSTVTSSYSDPRCHAKPPRQDRAPDNPGWDVPHLTKTPWEAERNKKRASWRRSKFEYQFPAHIFKKLPREVYDCILVQLEQIHLGGEQPCPNCYLADLADLSLVSRAWDKATTSKMYRKILLTANEEHTKLPKLNVKGTSRLKLLRRTLRECNAIARYVRELHLSDFQMLYDNAFIEREEIVNLVASLVMACPFLERLVGFNIPYTHTFDRLSHALSTRPNLRERVWLLQEKEPELSDDEEQEMEQYYDASRDPTECFLGFNAKHPLLTTLVLHQSDFQASTSLNFRSIVGTLRQLPVLRHLSISGLSASSFTNLAMNALPPSLESLRLENLPGIDDKGLQRLANSATAESITALTLININITNLLTISAILSSKFSVLLSLTIAQQKAPRLAPQSTIPDFNAPTLRSLHWEFSSEAGPLPPFPSSEESLEEPDITFPFTNTEPICCLATSVLSTSIRNGCLPSLERTRIPHDPQGVIQSLCKPLATALLPSDAAHIISYRSTTKCIPFLADPHYANRNKNRLSQQSQCYSPRADSAIESLSSSISLSSTILTPARSRLAAQSRIMAARKHPAMLVRVFDPSGHLQIDRPVGGHLGDVRSKITYDLNADYCRLLSEDVQDASERNEWVTGIEDLVGHVDVQASGMSEWARARCGHIGGRRVGKYVVNVEDIF